ncbi:MAG: T9SS type B sorting domain-containing protein [Allomuricauda sp.]
MKQSLLRWGIAACILLFYFTGEAQVKNNFEVRYENKLKGDLTFIANNIVNRDGSTTDPEDPYNSTGSSSSYNDDLNMQYIDIDGDSNTFSSSSATLSVPDPDCSLIRYAGLYWSAVYKGSDRSDFNQVKFQVPGGSYVDLTADEILFDGYNDSDFGNYSPYACYKEVTSLLTALPNPDGEYFVANVRASSGSSITGGISGGWSLVVVYENPTLPGKYITTFDGYAGIKSGQTVDIPFSGFTTLPSPFPVNAKLGVAALEGDNKISGDQLAIKADSNGSFTTLSNTVNPSNNFFNSNITDEGSIVTTRNPNSTNTLGWDVDLFTIPNPNQTVIPNDETGATLRASSTQDKYDIFFTSLDVEIIEPLMNLAKTVEDIGGNDITGQGVHLGQYLDYVLRFQNVGNDDAVNYTIKDVLPINVTLDEASITMPAGVTYTYDPLTRTIEFTIPNSIVEESDPAATIRMRVQVAENCFDFIDACTDIIQNLAYSTYQGAINTAQITDDPSVSDFDGCGFGTPGATNFLLDDLSACNFSRTVQLCGDDVLLDAGDNFDNYIWYRDENGNNQIDIGTDTVITDADSDNDPSTMLVSDVGTYLVDKQVADPCKDFMEIIVVELFGSVQSNPITALINDPSNTIDGDVIVCPNDGSETPEIFLCGLNDTELIQINIPDATSIVWQQLDEASCAAVTAGCANTNNTCTWNTVDTGNDFLASDAGQYRLVINYQNGCFSRFYFNIYKNPLDPQYTKRDIICNSPGNITVTNMPLNYEYQLIDQTTGNVLVAYNPSPSFDIATNGAYAVEMRQQGVVDGCVFILDNIGILERDFQVDVVPRDTDCNGLGEIAISILNVEPQYYYEISQGGTIVDTYGPSTDNNYTFENLNDGVYDVSVSTDDGCAYTEQVTILDLTDLELTARVSQHITCKEGNILMESSGGKTPHTYAIWSYVDDNGITQISYPSVNAVPASAFQTSQIFDIYDPGQYTFIVVDRNNCYDISNTVTIEFRPAADFDPTSVIDVLCYGDSTGSIVFNLLNSNGYQLTFYLFDATGFDEDNFDINNALATNTSGNFPGLASGDYVVVINQRKGSAACDYFEYQTISAPSNAISADAVLVQPYTCLQDGIIRVQNVTGGTAPYEYSIDGVNFVPDTATLGEEDFPNLTDGTYSITVRDANGCTFVTNSVTIDPLNPPTDISFAATNPLCPTFVSDVTLSVTGGTPALVYEIIAPAGSVINNGNNATFVGLSPDTYLFRVTDSTGCTYDESFTINPVNEISVIGQLISNITCFGDSDGELLFTIANFNTDYDYSVTGPANFSGNNQSSGTVSLTGLAEGTYTIVVTDNFTNCTDTASVTINAPAAALTLSAAEVQPTCITDGSVTLTSTGGWGGNTFTLTNPDATLFGSNSTGVFNTLVQTGTYTASVTDANGCIVTTTFTLNSAVPPVLSITPNNPCYDDAVGLTLTANVTSGGDGNFEYSLNGGPYGASNVFAGLTPGTHTIYVRDGNNCTDSASITIDPELSVVASAPNITACGTDTDITISAAGGDGNYVYAVVADGVAPVPGDFSVTNPVTVTGAGDYDVYVRDNNGAAGYCEASYDITIVQDAPLAITSSSTPVSCFGGSDGSITLSASGGEAPYLYSIDNGANYQVSGNFVNLSAGTYNLRIRDANNCETTGTITVTQPDPLVAEAQQTQAYTCLQLGEITVGSVTPTSGGSGDYQYSINGGPWTAPTTGGTVFTGLIDGTYTILVRDANQVDCFIALPDVIIAPLPVEPTLSTSVTYNCDGTGDVTVLPNDPTYTYSLDGGAFQAGNVFADVAVGIHTIDVNYGSDCITQTTVIVEPGNAFDASVIAFTNITCNTGSDGSITFEVENFDAINGFEYQVNGGGYSAPQTSSPITVSGLTAGNYTIEVRDVLDNSCIIILNQTLSEPNALITTASITNVLTCTNGGATITASATGGTPAYQYQLEDGVGGIIVAYQSSNIFTGLAAGDYIVRARDTNLCEDPIDVALTVVAPDPIIFTSTPTACYSGNSDGSIQVDVTSGNGDYQFSLNGGVWITPTPATATTHTFNNLTAGTYTIDVRDGFGCVGVQQSVTINPHLVANAVLNNDLTCLADATITITASGGSGSYTYDWSDDGGSTYNSSGFVGNVFTANADGTYQFRVTDTTLPVACTVVTNSIVVTPATTPVISNVIPTDILCNSEITGALDVIIDTSVGVPPYTINVVETSGPTNYGTQTTGLPAGSYEVTVTDDKGCVSAPFPVVISQPDPITYNTSDVPITCNAGSGTTDPGSITISGVSGGTAEYTYVLTANNGIAPQTYTTTPGARDHTFTVLEFGIYQIDVVDANGCASYTTEIIASPPNDLDIDVSTATVDCLVGGTAIVTVGSAVGSGNYEFAILETYTAPYSSSYQPPTVPGGDSTIFTGLTPGITYTFVVYDLTTNCYYFEEAAAPINTPSAMTATLDAVNNVSCTGSADANISFTFTGYDALATDVQYEIFNRQSNITTGYSGTASVNPPASVTVNNFATLPPGEYYLLLTEVNGPNNGCSVNGGEFTIRESVNALDLDVASPQNDNCNPNAGIITATGRYGTAPYTYQYLLSTDPAPTAASAGWTSTTFANVEAGDYIVYVKDAYGCIFQKPITVLEDPSPEISIAIVDECVDEGMFEILLTLDNPGTALPPFQLSLNGAPYQNITFNGSNQYTVSGLSSGLTQTISVRDVNGCFDTETIDIQPPLEFRVTQTVALDCEPGAAANAEIEIEVISGSGNYEYEIDGPGAIDQARAVLPSNPFTWTSASAAGSYSVTVYDIGTTPPNCFETITIDVPDAPLPSFTETHVDVTCNGGSDGSITLIEADTGIGPLIYTLTPMPGGAVLNGNTFENLPAGTYSVRGTGVNSCFTDIFNIQITEPNPVVVPAPTVVEFGCAIGNNKDNATLTVDTASITGGSGTYVIYEFINDQGTPATGDDVVVQSGPNNVYTETNIVGGSYTINVYDENGCLGTTTAVIAPFDELLSASVAVDAVATCISGEDITITATGSITNSTANPANYEFRELPAGIFQPSGSFTGLTVGTHNFEVRNTVTGCVITISHVVADPEVLDLIVVNTTNVTCFGDTDGSVELDLVDATNTTYASATSYTLYYDINNTPGNLADDITSIGSDADGNFTITGLAAGAYYIEVVDTNPPGSACVYTASFNIMGPNAGISASTQVTPVTCALNDGIIEIYNVSGGWGGYTYFVDLASNPAPTFPASYQASPLFSGLAGGIAPGTDYQVWVADQFGCVFQLPNVTLEDPASITANLQINQENCTNLQGEIEVVGTAGGQGSNYTYQLIRNGSAVGSPQTSTVFSGLGAGSYEVLIADQWSCTTTIGPVDLLDAMTTTTTVVKPIDCTVDPGGHITVNVSGGSSNLTFDVLFPDGVTTASNATGVFTGLIQPGIYIFTITDNDTATPCTYVVTQELDDKVDPIIDNVIEDPVSCNGGSDGSLTVVLDPATVVDPVYTYELYEISNLGTPYRFAQTSPVFDNLPPGDYRVRVISSRACEDFFDQTVTEPTPLTVSASATVFVCNPNNTVNTSTITVTASGGTGPYLYSIDNVNFQTSNTFAVVDNGAVQNITVYVRDASSCSTTDSVIIQPINTFTVAVAQNVAISCVNPEEVLLTVTDNGNPGNTYTFELLPVGNPYGSLTGTPTSTTATFELTAPGTYTFRVTDNATGCYVDTAPYSIAPYDVIDVVATATAPAICFGGAGTLEINVIGYTGTYDYEVFRSNGTTTGITGSANTTTNPLSITDPALVGGNYFVRVTETANPLCAEDSNTITIISPSMALDAAPVEVANVTCTNDQGEILVAPVGGYTPYNIVLTNTTTTQVYNINNVNSHVFTGLSAGVYDVQITDTNGCVINRGLNLVQPSPITADIDATPTTLVCYGDTDATVTAINVLGGEGVYQYQLNEYDSTGTIIAFTSGAQGSPVFDNLGAGIYSITVSDGWSCDVETPQVTITEPTDVMASLIQLSAMTCNNLAQTRLTASGGTGPYEFSVDNVVYVPMSGGNTHTFTVGAGVYQYYVRDAFGCGAQISNQVSVDMVPPLTITIDDSAAIINCTGEASATIRAVATGGLGNYSYELFGDAALTNLLAGPQNSGTFNGLVAGSYYVRVTSQDCVEVSPEILIVDPMPLQVDREEFTNVTCAGMNDGTITVEVSGGTGEIQYAITPNLDQFDTVNTFEDLAPGIYDVIAQDKNGCFITFQFEIVQPEPLMAEAVNILDEVCYNSADGSFELQITGGTAPYETALNSNADADFVQGQVLFQNLSAGTHVVFVRDAQGCDTNVFVEIEPGVNLAATVTPMYECTGNIPNNHLDIVFEDPTVSADVLYALDSTDPADMQLSADFTNIPAGDHFVTIAHANGCMVTYDFNIVGYEPLTLVLENNNINQITAIAEGGVPEYTFYFNDYDNGNNNTFYINRTDTYTVTVIDQNGCEATAQIFMEFIDIEMPNFFTPDGDGLNDTWIPENIEGFPNVLIVIYDRYGRVVERMTRDTQGWDGDYDGKPLPTGDYWYIVRLNGELDDREFVGHFTLYRQ